MLGLLNVYKPKGISSYDVIRQVRRRLGREVKTGHAGTLDPMAEGVLLVCIGPATRLVGVLQSHEKEYVVTAELGATSSTDDTEGEIRPTGAAAPAGEAVAAAVREFIGTIRQVPPAHSAVKVFGRRAYQLARQGKDVKLTARQVAVHALEILHYGWPVLKLRVICGGGTYIRALVRDVGGRLGVGGYCRELIRTRIGPFRAESAVKMEDLEAGPIQRLLIPPAEALPPDQRLPVSDAQAGQLALGREVEYPSLPESAMQQQALGAVDAGGRLIALVRPEPQTGRIRPVKVFPPA